MDDNKQSASSNGKSYEDKVKRDEEAKEKKRLRNREYQRAWRQRYRDLKKKVSREEKEAARRKMRENQKTYYNRRKKLMESEMNDELSQEKLDDRNVCRIWIKPCGKPDLEEKPTSNKITKHGLCTVRFAKNNANCLLNNTSRPTLLVPVNAFPLKKVKCAKNLAVKEPDKSQQSPKRIKIKEEEDEFDVFCRSLAVQLKSMPFDKACRCQEKLQAVISSELEQLDSIHLDAMPSSPKGWIQFEIPPSTPITPDEDTLVDCIKAEPEELT